MLDDRWLKDAACAKPGVKIEWFFPGRGDSIEEARTVCHGCPVRLQCLEYAVVNGERFGIWGGKSERQRRGIRRDQFPVGGFITDAVCHQCGKGFESVRSNPGNPMKYCSEDCRRQSATDRMAQRRAS